MTGADTIVQTFRRLGVDCSLSRVVEAAQVVRYELTPGPETRARDFRRLDRADDLAMALEAVSVSIYAPIPGTGLVGVEVARKDRQIVTADDLPRALRPITVPIGTDVENRPTLLMLDEAPHTLIAGATGGGKSVCLHTIISALVAEMSPEELRLCLIDPKKVELAAYEDLPHLLFPVADETPAAIQQLHALALVMEDRYSFFKLLGARDLKEANAKLVERGANPLPYFVCVCDELADLMMMSRKEVEGLLVRIAQKGRAAGIHLILATQYPLSTVLTGLLRVNLPTKICFSVPDMTASRVVIGQNGAERLLGKGDGLISFAGLPPIRFQSAYVSPERVSSVVNQWKAVTT